MGRYQQRVAREQLLAFWSLDNSSSLPRCTCSDGAVAAHSIVSAAVDFGSRIHGSSASTMGRSSRRSGLGTCAMQYIAQGDWMTVSSACTENLPCPESSLSILLKTVVKSKLNHTSVRK